MFIDVNKIGINAELADELMKPGPGISHPWVYEPGTCVRFVRDGRAYVGDVMMPVEKSEERRVAVPGVGEFTVAVRDLEPHAQPHGG